MYFDPATEEEGSVTLRPYAYEPLVFSVTMPPPPNDCPTARAMTLLVNKGGF